MNIFQTFSILAIFVINVFAESGTQLSSGKIPMWKETSYRASLHNAQMVAKFQGGILYELVNRQTGVCLIENHPEQLPSVIALFGTTDVNLDEAIITLEKDDRQVNVKYHWIDGREWRITWRMDLSGDLILQTSAKSNIPVDRFCFMIDGFDLANHRQVIVTNFGVGIDVGAPFVEAMPATEKGKYNPKYVMPIVTLFEGQTGGCFLEGRNKNFEPANIITYGKGITSDLVIVKGYPSKATELQMFDIRIRTYKDSWQKAVDSYINWMEKDVGYVSIENKPQKWIKDIRAYSMIEPFENVQGYGLAALERLAKVVDPKKTLLGKLSEYRPLPKFGFDHYWGDYRPSENAIKFFQRAKELGFHIGIHYNTTGIDLRFTDLIYKFKPGLQQKGQDKNGKPIYAGHNGTWSNVYGPVTFAYCSTAYKPYREFLIKQMKPAIDVGVEVVYLDESHTPTGKFLIDNVTAIQGVMMLEKEIIEAYPHVAVMTEMFNPMNSRWSSFALATMNMGHPLGGYIFHRFVKFTGWWEQYMPLKGEMLDFRLNWGYLLPGTDGTASPWLEIAQAFQKYNLDPAPLLPLSKGQLFSFTGDKGINAYFEKQGKKCGLVVYPPNDEPKWYEIIKD